MNKHFKLPFWNPEIEQVVDEFIKAVQVDLAALDPRRERTSGHHEDHPRDQQGPAP